MDEVLQKLKDGVRRFQAEVYPRQAEIFARAVSGPQHPHTLFITCADSRIDPNAITSSGTGELFVTRNIGNMVPAYGGAPDGTGAVIEFAVSALRVRHIVICGHTPCGAMQALLSPDLVANMPAVRSWLKDAQAALPAAEALHHQVPAADAPTKAVHDILTEQNVLLQMRHLKTHPSVADAAAAGALTLSGWVYSIGSGDIRIAEEGARTFTPIGNKVPTGA